MHHQSALESSSSRAAPSPTSRASYRARDRRPWRLEPEHALDVVAVGLLWAGGVSACLGSGVEYCTQPAGGENTVSSLRYRESNSGLPLSVKLLFGLSHVCQDAKDVKVYLKDVRLRFICLREDIYLGQDLKDAVWLSPNFLESFFKTRKVTQKTQLMYEGNWGGWEGSRERAERGKCCILWESVKYAMEKGPGLKVPRCGLQYQNERGRLRRLGETLIGLRRGSGRKEGFLRGLNRAVDWDWGRRGVATWLGAINRDGAKESQTDGTDWDTPHGGMRHSTGGREDRAEGMKREGLRCAKRTWGGRARERRTGTFKLPANHAIRARIVMKRSLNDLSDFFWIPRY
ncbi:hypothetical protein B0H17DRAFT_1123594 [Mycena rosella]|uniref:Uncharacterized protein n=1 Tax=Mycena rosella TaxID=1033263 RepID=A0AAD7H2J8_MYCRO|nr:hypothetical protein B0H17DRAFT_1123594 [Mycena rosella]